MISVQNLFLETIQKYPNINRRYARLVLASLMHQTYEYLLSHPEASVDSKIIVHFQQKIDALEKGMPLSRLLGKREFWGMTFQLSEATLDPRPDSETLIEATLKHCQNKQASLRILDLGTGTGCLIISLLKEYSKASGLAVDQSQEALRMAEINARFHKVWDRMETHCGDWFQGVTGQFDVIISNPPYIAEKDYETLDPNVKNYDPKEALVAGSEGLDYYKEIINQSKGFLKEGGLVVFELGLGQREKVSDLLKEVGIHRQEVFKDLSNIERCIMGWKESSI